MRNRDAQRFGDDLRRGGRPQKLAASTRRGAGPAAHLGGFDQADLAVSVPRPDRLDLAGVFAVLGGKGHAAGHEHPGDVL